MYVNKLICNCYHNYFFVLLFTYIFCTLFNWTVRMREVPEYEVAIASAMQCAGDSFLIDILQNSGVHVAAC